MEFFLPIGLCIYSQHNLHHRKSDPGHISAARGMTPCCPCKIHSNQLLLIVVLGISLVKILVVVVVVVEVDLVRDSTFLKINA
jgi:hypothetical protein